MAHLRDRYEAVNSGSHHPTTQIELDEWAQDYTNAQATPLQQPCFGARLVCNDSRGSSPLSAHIDKQPGLNQASIPGLGSFLLQWWKEVSAILLSVAFLVAVFIVLFKIEDTSLDNWSAPWSLNPTTLIAILIALCKLSLLAAVAEGISQLKWIYFEKKTQKLDDIEQFDSASRGVTGAVAFLFLVRWRAMVASAGALVVVLAIAMEPFAQQTLSFYSKAVPDESGVASIPRATSYDLNTVSPDFADIEGLGSKSKKIYAPVLSSILEGLYNPDHMVKAECATSNCTWQETQTLGVCSSCTDVSLSLKSNCQQLSPDVGISPTEAAPGAECQYETPSGGKLGAYIELFAGGNDFTVWNSTTQLSFQLPDIIKIAAISIDDGVGLINGSSTNITMSRPIATECSVSWCARTIRSGVVNGTLTENVTWHTNLIFPKDTCNSSSTSDADIYQLKNWALDKSYQDEYPSGYVQLYAAFLPGDVPRNMCADWRSQPNSAFWVNVVNSGDISGLFTEVFTASYTTLNSQSSGSGVLAEMFYAINNANLTADLESIATSMTNLVRQGPNMTMHHGTSWQTETYIRVNWPWFTYPCGLVLLAIAFLVLAIIASARGSRVVWKSSSLALLFHGVNGLSDEAEARSFRSTSEMKEVATSMRVRLNESDGQRLRLVVE